MGVNLYLAGDLGGTLAGELGEVWVGEHSGLAMFRLKRGVTGIGASWPSGNKGNGVVGAGPGIGGCNTTALWARETTADEASERVSSAVVSVDITDDDLEKVSAMGEGLRSCTGFRMTDSGVIGEGAEDEFDNIIVSSGNRAGPALCGKDASMFRIGGLNVGTLRKSRTF